MAQWFALCDKVTGEPVSFCTDDSQDFNLSQLQAKFTVNPMTKQPAGEEFFDKVSKTIQSKK